MYVKKKLHSQLYCQIKKLIVMVEKFMIEVEKQKHSHNNLITADHFHQRKTAPKKCPIYHASGMLY